MTKQLTRRQEQERNSGMEAHRGYQAYVNNHNALIAKKGIGSLLVSPSALSISFFSGKIYAGPKSKSTRSGAARLKRSAKKLGMAKARASKR